MNIKFLIIETDEEVTLQSLGLQIVGEMDFIAVSNDTVKLDVNGGSMYKVLKNKVTGKLVDAYITEIQLKELLL